MEIIRADKAGFCYGVKRAIEMVENELDKRKGKNVYITGSLIHNDQVNKKLEEQGLIKINNLNEIEEGIVVIPSHGVSPEIIDSIQAKGLAICQATCPHVIKAQKLAQQLDEENYQVLILGERGHSEVKGILGHTGNRGIVIEKLEDLEKINLAKKVGIVVQTTQNKDGLSQMAKEIAPKVKELKIYNTICHATEERQKAATKLAKEVDLMIVVGGYNSSNTKRLKEICQKTGLDKVHHLETWEELKKEMLEGIKKVGLTAGASTPDWIIEKIEEQIRIQGDN